MPLCNTVAVTLSILCISPCSTNQCQMGKIVVKPFLRMTTISQLVSGSYPLTRQIATILIWNSVPQSPISRSRSHRHQTFFRLFHFIFPIRFIPLLNPFSTRLFLQPRQVHLRFLLISALSFPRLIYLIHGHFIVDDPRR